MVEELLTDDEIVITAESVSRAVYNTCSNWMAVQNFSHLGKRLEFVLCDCRGRDRWSQCQYS